MLTFSDLRAAARKDSKLSAEGGDWIAIQVEPQGPVVKLRWMHVDQKIWIQVLAPIAAIDAVSLIDLLRATAQRVFGAPALEGKTLFLREALAVEVATWPRLVELAELLLAEAKKLTASTAVRREPVVFGSNFAD